MTETIIFNNRDYPARYIEIDSDGTAENQCVSVHSLEKIWQTKS